MGMLKKVYLINLNAIPQKVKAIYESLKDNYTFKN